jgi:preprotein translocase subunit SecF
MYKIVQKRKIFLTISLVLCLLSILFLNLFGLKFGIDFKGGTRMELKFYNQIPKDQEIKDKLKVLNLGDIIVQRTAEGHVILKFKEIDENLHQKILEILNHPEELRFESIGPSIGHELTRKARVAVLIVLLAILIYISLAFKRLSKIFRKSESWRYGVGAILALIHDLILILGLYSLLCRLKGIELNSSFIVAILTVLGYSVNDTIVVYDRIRENIILYGYKNFEEIVNKSLNETLVRSLATTITTVLAILAIILFGPESIFDFMLALAFGISTGAWSSISIAVPFLFFKRK